MAHVDAFVLQKNEFVPVEVTRAVCTAAYVLSHSNRILISSSIILIIVLSRLFLSRPYALRTDYRYYDYIIIVNIAHEIISREL